MGGEGVGNPIDKINLEISISLRTSMVDHKSKNVFLMYFGIHLNMLLVPLLIMKSILS